MSEAWYTLVRLLAAASTLLQRAPLDALQTFIHRSNTNPTTLRAHDLSGRPTRRSLTKNGNSRV